MQQTRRSRHTQATASDLVRNRDAALQSQSAGGSHQDVPSARRSANCQNQTGGGLHTGATRITAGATCLENATRAVDDRTGTADGSIGGEGSSKSAIISLKDQDAIIGNLASYRRLVNGPAGTFVAHKQGGAQADGGVTRVGVVFIELHSTS